MKADELRKKAEEFIKKSDNALEFLTNEDLLALANELQIQQIKLELQNDELRRAKEEVTIVSNKYSDLYDFAPVGFFSLNAEGKILEVNLRATILLARSKDSLIDLPFSALIEPRFRNAFHIHLQRTFERETPQIFEVEIKKSDGTILFAELQSVSLSLPDSTVRQCRTALIDISDRKQSEAFYKKYMQGLQSEKSIIDLQAKELANIKDKLSETETNLKNLLNQKDKLFSMLNQDLKDSFGKTIFELEFVLNNFGKLLNEDLKSRIYKIYNDSFDFHEVIENLIYWSKIQISDLTLIPKNINLKEAFEKQISAVKTYCLPRNISIIGEIDREIYVYVDETAFNVVIRNILSNAIKFSENSKKIVFFAVSKDTLVEISIIDSGKGMSETQLQSIFKKNPENHSIKTESQIPGFGVKLCKALIEKSGGAFNIKSSEDKGVKVVFTLPKKIS